MKEMISVEGSFYILYGKQIDLYDWNVLYALKGQKHLAQGNTLG